MIQIIYCLSFLLTGAFLSVAGKTCAPAKSTITPSSKVGSNVVLPQATPIVATGKAPREKEKKPAASATVSRPFITPLYASKPGIVLTNNVVPSIPAASGTTPVIRNSMLVPADIRSQSLSSESARADSRLARVTAYWAGEGDYYTGRCISATGVRLHDGHCAVDPNVIPYGSVVKIAGVGNFLAVDTGSAVISRQAAKESGHTSTERHALVIDIFFEDRNEGKRFASGAAKFAHITWWTPTAMNSDAQAARSLFAEENWTKIQGKQL